MKHVFKEYILVFQSLFAIRKSWNYFLHRHAEKLVSTKATVFSDEKKTHHSFLLEVISKTQIDFTGFLHNHHSRL